MSFYQCPGFNFNDFDLIVHEGFLYAVYVKKVPFKPGQGTAAEEREPNRYGLARTGDGEQWEEVGDILLPRPSTWEESLWAGSIVKRDGRFILYYTGVTMAGREKSCKIGRAFSTDLLHWERDPGNPILTLQPGNPHYADEPLLQFRDPFPFEHGGRRYLLFAARDKRRPKGKRGCVGIVEETEHGYQWLPPLFSPGMYVDGLECPAIYGIEGRWYLLFGEDSASGHGHRFHYAVARRPFGPYREPEESILLPEGCYTSRIVEFRGKLLLYHWVRDFPAGLVRERIAPPKKVRMTHEGMLHIERHGGRNT